MAYDPTHEYEHRYEPAIRARKMANAARTKQREWIAADDRAQEIIDFLEGYPAGQDAGFFCAVKYGILTFGKPTDTMRDKMVEILDDRKAKAAEWAAQDAKSSWIGEVGMRGRFTFNVSIVSSWDGMYGTTYLHVCRDDNGNIIIYKGSNPWNAGDKITCMAKVKAHELREGVKQTVIQRPTKVEINVAQ